MNMTLPLCHFGALLALTESLQYIMNDLFNKRLVKNGLLSLRP